MKKTALLLIFIIVLVASISIFPIAAFAECNDDITEGDLSTFMVSSGFNLVGDYAVEIAYENYTLYSSGIYRAFVITFDKEYCESIAESSNGQINGNTLLFAFELFFSSRGYTLEKDVENARFTASIKYESITDLYVDMGIDGYENDDSSGVETKGFFFREYKNTNKTVFSSAETPGNLISGMIQLCYQLDICKEDILLNYTYGTPYKIIKTDADETKYLPAQKIYTHSYNMTMSNFDREITLTQVTPNASGWYTLAIGFALVVLSLPLLIAILKKKEGKNG